MAETVRLRVFFEEASSILSRSKKKEGLERCWVFLKPQLQTVSDLASHLLYTFSLSRTCPNGIILSMDGFVLPPFESTCIFKDKDIVCARKKENEKSDEDARPLYTSLIGEFPALIEDFDLEDQDIDEYPEFRNKETCKEETEDNKSDEEEEEEEEEDGDEEHNAIDEGEEDVAVTKKRKASKNLRSSKKKKCKLRTAGDCKLTADVLKGKNQRSCQPQDNGQGNLDIYSINAETKKLPGRSTRRKKARRKWLREQVKPEKEKETQSQIPEIEEHQPPEKADNKASVVDQNQNEESDGDDDVVPVLVKPGHIRFEPLGKEDQVVQQNQSSVLQESLHWNGITSKKKGQKWGIEKTPSSKRINLKSSYRQPHAIVSNEVMSRDVTIDFNKLPPCSSFPKEGDVIAYRMLELSESWTPVPSSSRVGKLLHSNPESKRIKLAPVPEYPFEFKKTSNDEMGSSIELDDSPYSEDGTLETDYSLLLDVRMIEQCKLDTAEADMVDEHPADITKGARENGEGNVWEEINQALSAKKAQLSQEDGWKTEDSSCKHSWLYKGLRRGALGPTIAYLRDQNGL